MVSKPSFFFFLIPQACKSVNFSSEAEVTAEPACPTCGQRRWSASGFLSAGTFGISPRAEGFPWAGRDHACH